MSDIGPAANEPSGAGARALIESNAREAVDLVGELTLLLDRVGNENAYLARARMVTRRIADRLGQVITLDRLERSGSLRPDTWSPIAMLEELEHEAVALAGNRIDVAVDTPELVPQCWFFDRELVGMALGNALHNALHHAQSRLVLGLALKDGLLGFSVSDDGGAFPPELLADTPAPVARGEVNGNALGVHFARVIAAAHVNAGRVGHVELANRERGPGTRFTLWLP